LRTPSVQTAPNGSGPIVWMIKAPDDRTSGAKASARRGVPRSDRPSRAAPRPRGQERIAISANPLPTDIARAADPLRHLDQRRPILPAGRSPASIATSSARWRPSSWCPHAREVFGPSAGRIDKERNLAIYRRRGAVSGLEPRTAEPNASVVPTRTRS
jgi:hypothetical protein